MTNQRPLIRIALDQWSWDSTRPSVGRDAFRKRDLPHGITLDPPMERHWSAEDFAFVSLPRWGLERCPSSANQEHDGSLEDLKIGCGGNRTAVRIAVRWEKSLGGDDTRERMSTTLVVAWMSPPPFSFHRSEAGLRGAATRLERTTGPTARSGRECPALEKACGFPSRPDLPAAPQPARSRMTFSTGS